MFHQKDRSSFKWFLNVSDLEIELWGKCHKTTDSKLLLLKSESFGGLLLQSDTSDLLIKSCFPQVRSRHCRRRGVTAVHSVPPALHGCRRAILQPPASTRKQTTITVPVAWQLSAAHPGRACLPCLLWMRCMNSSRRVAMWEVMAARASTVTRTRMLMMRTIVWETAAMHHKLMKTVLPKDSQAKRSGNSRVKKLTRNSKKQQGHCSTLLESEPALVPS